LSQTLPPKSSLWALLFEIDLEFRDQARSDGCKHCGGRLHQANFMRKPRGSTEDLESHHKLRFGLCCGDSGCRRRVLPPSSRFLGRRVYLGIIVVLVAAFRQGSNAKRVSILTGAFGADRRTIERWCKWWREDFQQSPIWRILRGQILFAEEPVPKRFILAFDAQESPSSQSLLMRFLCGSSP
jgi:hypothetical protein